MPRDAFKLIRWARGIRGLTPPQKLVLIVLASYANGDGECWPSIVALAEDTGAGKSTVRRVLGELEAADLIEREPRYRRDGAGGRTSSLYRIRAPDAL